MSASVGVTPVISEYVTNGPPTISRLQEDHNHSRSTNVEHSKLLACTQLDKSLAESLAIPLTRVFLPFWVLETTTAFPEVSSQLAIPGQLSNSLIEAHCWSQFGFLA